MDDLSLIQAYRFSAPEHHTLVCTTKYHVATEHIFKEHWPVIGQRYTVHHD